MVGQYVIDAHASRFTVRAFASGILAAMGHNPTFAVRDFSGEVNLDPAAPAQAAGDVTVFPPSNQAACTGQTGYLGWDTDSNSTSCNTGQDIFTRTLGCGANEYVAFDGQRYICKSVPACSSNEYLNYDGSNFQCATLPNPPRRKGAAGL